MLLALPAIGHATPPRIDVVDGGWGAGLPHEIQSVLEAVAAEFPPPVAPDGRRALIRIRHRFGGPQISYDRDAEGWLVIQLSARDNRWYQYIYQFAHEYCHLLARFDRKQDGADIVRDRQWFEESLCETASLFALSRLEQAWRQPGQPAMFRDAVPILAQYRKQLETVPHRWLDPGTDFASWYARNQDALDNEPYLRGLNELAAMQFLPLFERAPANWRALAYLYATPPRPGQDFSAFLANWHSAAPDEYKPFIAEIRRLFSLPPKAMSQPAKP